MLLGEDNFVLSVSLSCSILSLLSVSFLLYSRNFSSFSLVFGAPKEKVNGVLDRSSGLADFVRCSGDLLECAINALKVKLFFTYCRITIRLLKLCCLSGIS